jgi:CheY-like chemotaxis protein
MADNGRDHDRARQAVEAGEVLPLRTILERVEREYPGQVIDVELEREHENNLEPWVYKIKLLRSGGSADQTQGRCAYRRSHRQEGAQRNGARTGTTWSSPRWRGQLMRILIVEDEPTLQAQLAEGLGAASYAVDTAGNGVDGHYLGDTESYDAVVLDLGLPQMDGITVLRKWRAADARCRC